MPALKPEYEALAGAVSGRLRGDPSLPLDEEPEEEPPAADEDEEVGTISSLHAGCGVGDIVSEVSIHRLTGISDFSELVAMLGCRIERLSDMYQHRFFSMCRRIYVGCSVGVP